MSVSPLFAAILATLSVLGAYFLLKILFSLLFGNKTTAAAVLVTEKKALKDLDLSIADAASALFYTKNRKLGILIPKTLFHSLTQAEQFNLQEIADAYGAEIYIFFQ